MHKLLIQKFKWSIYYVNINQIELIYKFYFFLKKKYQISSSISFKAQEKLENKINKN